jgi:hypothetical protein
VDQSAAELPDTGAENEVGVGYSLEDIGSQVVEQDEKAGAAAE